MSAGIWYTLFGDPWRQKQSPCSDLITLTRSRLQTIPYQTKKLILKKGSYIKVLQISQMDGQAFLHLENATQGRSSSLQGIINVSPWAKMIFISKGFSDKSLLNSVPRKSCWQKCLQVAYCTSNGTKKKLLCGCLSHNTLGGRGKASCFMNLKQKLNRTTPPDIP